MPTIPGSAPMDLPRSRGRPREFDRDEALDRAIRIFCQRGYHATSIGELGEAMGLTAGSIYKAFKDKRAVFLAALDRAIRIFCQRGYHATSIGELGEAMGLTAGSIYKAFKDKRAVFLAA